MPVLLSLFFARCLYLSLKCFFGLYSENSVYFMVVFWLQNHEKSDLQDEELSGIGGSTSSRSNSISSFQSYHSSATTSENHLGDKATTPRPLIPIHVVSSAGSDLNRIDENSSNTDKVACFYLYKTI